MSNTHVKQWSSRWTFILAATGSAVGLGNVWKFPYMAGENGGGAFVLFYLLCVLLVGIPILMAEILLGRRGGVDPVHSTTAVALESKRSKHWRFIGVFGILASFLLLSYYAVIAGTSGAYLLKSLTGVFYQQTSEQIQIIYDNYQANVWQMVFWDTAFLVTTAVIVLNGLKTGIERFISVMVPMLFFILVLLVLHALFLSGHFLQSVDYLFIPRFNHFSTSGMLFALGHALFTLSIATASMLIYGCYLNKKIDIGRSALTIALLDTLTALLAGLAIFPIVFKHGLLPESGPALVFKTLPIAFAQMPMSEMVGGLFFALLLLAALGSSISMLEPIVAWLAKGGVHRTLGTIVVTSLIWILSLGTVFSFNIWQGSTIFGQWSFYALIDNIVSIILLPLGAIMMAIFCGWFMQPEYAREELQLGNPLLFKLWLFSVRYVAPLTVIITVATSLL